MVYILSYNGSGMVRVLISYESFWGFAGSNICMFEIANMKIKLS
jgi:hypothetical protein